MGRHAVDSNQIFIDDLFVPDADRIGAEGRGFQMLLDSLNPERILIAAEAIAIGQDALRRACGYARERRVFGRPIGQNQAIQHPLAERWAELEAAWLMTHAGGRRCTTPASRAARRRTRPSCSARGPATRPADARCMTHGGFGYAKEFHVERLLREVMITRLAPVSEQLILSYIAERVLDLPKSY